MNARNTGLFVTGVRSFLNAHLDFVHLDWSWSIFIYEVIESIVQQQALNKKKERLFLHLIKWQKTLCSVL